MPLFLRRFDWVAILPMYQYVLELTGYSFLLWEKFKIRGRFLLIRIRFQPVMTWVRTNGDPDPNQALPKQYYSVFNYLEISHCKTGYKVCI